MRRLSVVLVSLYILTSCASHHGIISSSSINRSVTYEDVAYGVSQTNTYFGVGGLAQDALVLEAKRELMKNRPLKPDEEYANFTVDFKRAYWPFYIQTKVTVSADVVRFINDSIYDPYSENYKNKLSSLNLSNDLFAVSDSILFEKSKKGTIVSIEDIDRVRIVYKTQSGKIRTKKISINDIYTMSKTFKGYKIGDRFIYSVKVSGEEKQTSGKIVALGLNSLIIRDNSNLLQVLAYDN